MSLFKKTVKLILGAFNIHLVSSNAYKQDKYRVSVLNRLDIDLVADVGANIGQYAKELIKAGYKNKIISFEPLTDVYAALQKASSIHPQWTIYERCAIGNETGEITINVSENYESSSIYNVLDKSIEAEPGTKFVKKETVKIVKLADVLKYAPGTKIHLKIDVQGFEEQALMGAAAIFNDVSSIEVEISMLPLYEGALSPQVLLTKLSDYGFSPAFYTSVFDDVNTGGFLQLNGLFVKTELLHLIS
jgi:FkbM family methyltransferase